MTSLVQTQNTAGAANNVPPTSSVVWHAIDDASGVKNVTVYVADNGGDLKIWQKQIAGESGQAIFTGTIDHHYEFLAAATDNAGNREAASVTNAVLPDDGSAQQISDALGGNQTVTSSTELPAGSQDRTYASNALFQTATQQLPGFVAPVQQGDLRTVLAPFTVRAFADGFRQSSGDIGALIKGVSDDYFALSLLNASTPSHPTR